MGQGHNGVPRARGVTGWVMQARAVKGGLQKSRVFLVVHLAHSCSVGEGTMHWGVNFGTSRCTSSKVQKSKSDYDYSIYIFEITDYGNDYFINVSNID